MFSRLSTEAFRDIESRLSEPLFMGVPLGATLNNSLVVKLIDGHEDWKSWKRLRNRVLIARYSARPTRGSSEAIPPLKGMPLFTWERRTPRFDQLLLPVMGEFDVGEYAVFYGTPGVRSGLPVGTPAFGWEHVPMRDPSRWRTEFDRLQAGWSSSLSEIRRMYDLPKGVPGSLFLDLMLASQRVAACLDFLELNRPSVIVTEYDRSYLWSCLVLAARHLGIPTVTFVHGVVEQDAVGFSPVLADRILCWGKLDQDKFISAGESPEKLLVSGCPRLTRDLSATKADGRAKLGLQGPDPVAMFATTPSEAFVPLVEAFCEAVEDAGALRGFVRLHPSDRLRHYGTIIRMYPRIRFTTNSELTLDESLAAADVVVVRGSGVGGDALIKRRPVVVLNPEKELVGHDWDLVEGAGCPRVKNAQELSETLRELTGDSTFQAGTTTAAEHWVTRFCSYFGQESARLIASIVRNNGEMPETAGRNG